MKNKLRNFNFQVKATDDGKMAFEGYGSIFGNVDSYKDVVVKGAFKETLQDKQGKLKILWQHKWDEPIGKIIEAKEDNIGLWIKAELSDTEKGREAYTLLKDGVIDELSIGYSIIEDEYDRDKGIRYLKALELFEVSCVSFAANSQAIVTSVKSLKDRLPEGKDLMQNLEGQKIREERWRIESAFNEVIWDLLDDDEMPDEDKISEFQTSLEQYSTLMTEWFDQMLNLEKSELIDIQTKAGKVLSAKNRKKVKVAADALMGLLEATDDSKSIDDDIDDKDKQKDDEKDLEEKESLEVIEEIKNLSLIHI